MGPAEVGNHRVIERERSESCAHYINEKMKAQIWETTSPRTHSHEGAKPQCTPMFSCSLKPYPLVPHCHGLGKRKIDINWEEKRENGHQKTTLPEDFSRILGTGIGMLVGCQAHPGYINASLPLAKLGLRTHHTYICWG